MICRTPPQVASYLISTPHKIIPEYRTCLRQRHGDTRHDWLKSKTCTSHLHKPPAQVLANASWGDPNQLLDFEHISQWHTAHFKSIVVPSGKKAMDLAPGDKLALSLNSLPLNFTPTVVVRISDPSSTKLWLTEGRKTHHTDLSGAEAIPGSLEATMSLNFYHRRRIQAGPCFSITRNSAECLHIL